MEQKQELEFYEKEKNWDFDKFEIQTEEFTNWDLYQKLREVTTSDSRVLDLGTGGGEKVLRYYPEDLKEIVGTDFSPEMIKTANENLKRSKRKNVTFKVMNNLDIEFKDESFDVIVARNTVINAKEIYRVLKQNGVLLLSGVDKYDCHSLKLTFGRGQAFHDEKPISIIDYEDIINAGFKDVELVPLHEREYFKNKQLLMEFLKKVPILDDFSEENENFEEERKQPIDEETLDKYIEKNTYEKGIRLIRRYYGITARK